MNNNFFKTKVMLVDDNPIDILINSKVIELTQLADETIVCNTGAEALAELKGRVENNCELPSLIFLDVNMPQMSGLQFLEEFSKLPQQFTEFVKIVMLTSSLDEGDYKKAMSCSNVALFLSKPLSTDKIEFMNRKGKVA